MDKQMHTGMILVDLLKVFNTSDYAVLLEKIKILCFPDICCEMGWVLSLKQKIFGLY